MNRTKSTIALLAGLALGLILVAPLGCTKTEPTSPDGSKIVLSANPQSILLGNATSGTSTLTVTVFDKDGHTLSGVGVRFTATAGKLRSNGAAIKTDSNGIARDVLTLTADDAESDVTAHSGSNDSDLVKVTIGGQNDPPVARSIVTPTTAHTNESVNFDATNSTDPQGNSTIVGFKWTLTSSFTDGRPPEVVVVQGDGNTASSFNRTFTDDRRIIVQLQVTDNLGLSSGIQTNVPDLEIKSNLAPTAVAGNDFTTQVNVGFTLSAVSSHDDPRDTTGAIVRYDWDFGNGTQFLNRTTPTVANAYSTTGIFNVVLTVWDNGNGVLTDPVNHFYQNQLNDTDQLVITVTP